MAWRAALPATVLSLLAFVACRGATGDALPVAPAPRPSALPAVAPIAPCPTAAPSIAASTAARVPAAAPSEDPLPAGDAGPWISTLPRDGKRLGSHVLCGTTRCEGETPVCCADPRWPRCLPTSVECEQARLECLSANDCGAGRVCCAGVSGETRCATTCNNGDTPVCQKASDCRGVKIPFVEGMSRPAERCLLLQTGVKHCAPEWE